MNLPDFLTIKIAVVFWLYIGYNKINLKCATTPVSFEPTDTLNGIPTSSGGCQALTHLRGLEGKAKAQIAVTHLAQLGVKRQEPAFWGQTHIVLCLFETEEKAALNGCFFYLINSLPGMEYNNEKE